MLKKILSYIFVFSLGAFVSLVVYFLINNKASLNVVDDRTRISGDYITSQLDGLCKEFKRRGCSCESVIKTDKGCDTLLPGIIKSQVIDKQNLNQKSSNLKYLDSDMKKLKEKYGDDVEIHVD